MCLHSAIEYECEPPLYGHAPRKEYETRSDLDYNPHLETNPATLETRLGISKRSFINDRVLSQKKAKLRLKPQVSEGDAGT